MATYAVDGFSRGSPDKIEHFIFEAKKYKDSGNQYYQKKEFKAAIRCYHKALLYIRSINQGQDTVGTMLGVQQKEALPQDLILRISKLTLDCHNNLAVCIMQKDNPDYDKVITYCDLVLAEQPGNHKAHYRKGQALYKQNKYDTALASFLSAKEHMPSAPDCQLKNYIDLCHLGMKRDDQGLKSMYKSMFKSSTAAASSNTAVQH